jgi:arylsulfatase A-like enzyme
MHRRPSSALLPLAALLGAGCGPAPQGPRVVESALLFAVDTLRADGLGTYGGRPSTPHLDRFADQALVFERAYTQATHTHPAMTSVLTGLAPMHHGVLAQNLRYRPGTVPLAEVLQAEGLETGSFVANLCKLQDYGRSVWSEGWDEQFCGEDDALEQYLWDEAVVGAAERWIEGRRGRFFAWVHLMDPHGEYRPPPDLWDYATRPVPDRAGQNEFYAQFSKRWELPSDAELRELADLYGAQIEGVDRLFGRMIEFLRARGLLERCAVVFVSDHGEELFETWPKAAHGLSLTEGVLHVPLMIAAPGVAAGRSPLLVETLQVTPTLLELLGIEAPLPLDGPSLLAPEPSRGWAGSYEGDRVTVRRDLRRWWARSPLLREPRSIREYRTEQPYVERAPWYAAEELLAEYEPGQNQPRWLEIDGRLRRLVRAAFKEPFEEFVRSSAAAEPDDEIVDPALGEQLERLGYR